MRPGLIWRRGQTPVWRASPAAKRAGYPVKWVNLACFADDPRVTLPSPGDPTLVRRGDRPLGLHQDKPRDAQLGLPKLILPSVQVNMRAGQFPPAEGDGQAYLKIPLNKF